MVQEMGNISVVLGNFFYVLHLSGKFAMPCPRNLSFFYTALREKVDNTCTNGKLFIGTQTWTFLTTG